MKKYTLFSYVFILSLILLAFNAKTTLAYDSGCTSGGPYSTTTGQLCSTTTSTDCATGDLFSSLTGQPCSGTQGNSSAVAQFNSLYSSNFTVGYKGSDVKPLQQFLKDQGYYFGKIDGKYGKITARAVSDFESDNNIVNTVTPLPLPIPIPPLLPGVSSPIISGVSGPQSLGVYQSGTWSVTASDPNGANLSYSVRWGDEIYYAQNQSAPTASPVAQQSATFTHTYSQSGIYIPVFTVTNANGQSTQASLSVNVGNVTPTSSITVLSPNGGETFYQTNVGPQAVNRISWSGGPFSGVHVGLLTGDSTNSNRNFVGWIWNGTSADNSIMWDTKTICAGFTGSVGNGCSQVSPGSYKIYIVGDVANVLGQAVEDLSDAPFSIVPVTVTPANLTINGSTSNTFTVGQSGTLNLTSSFPSTMFTLCTIDNHGAQSCTPNWAGTDVNGAWTYSRAFVTSDVGNWTMWIKFPDGTQSNQIILIVSNSVPLKVVSPNGGETFIQGQNNVISWQGDPVTATDIVLANSTGAQIGYINTPIRQGWGVTVLTGNKNVIYWTGQQVGSDRAGTSVIQIQPGQYKIILNNAEGSSISSTDISDAPFSITSSTNPSSVSILATLNPSLSTASQNAPVGINGASNLTKATYNFVSSGGTATITELKFSATAANTVSSISMNGISAPVVNGIADLTGLNITAPNNGSGINEDAYISYPGVGVNGIPSGSTSHISLEYIKYTSGSTTSTQCTTVFGSCTGVMTAVASPVMTLVSATVTVPSLTINGANSGTFTVGQSGTLNLTSSLPSTMFTLCTIDNHGVQSCTPNWATTDGNGAWTYSRAFVTSDVGNWTMWLQFPNGTQSNNITLTIATAVSSLVSPSSLTASVISAYPSGCSSNSGYSITTGKSCAK